LSGTLQGKPNGWDVDLTSGQFWGGSQIDGNWYKLTVIVGGMLALDHLYLRSPKTFLLKLLVNTFTSLWYFYDIAQAFGEWDSIKEHGIGVPYYGPVGIGHGIFHEGNKVKSEAKGLTPGWFIIYAIVTFITWPIGLNKVVLGDTYGALWHFFSLFIFVGVFWGLYDIYRLLFDTRKLFNTTENNVDPKIGGFRIKFNEKVGFEHNFKGFGPAEDPIPRDEPNGDPHTFAELGSAMLAATPFGKGLSLIPSGFNAKAEAEARVANAQAAQMEAANANKAASPGLKHKGGFLQTGGAAVQEGKEPSTTSSVLLFCMGLLSAGGYVLYSLRKQSGSHRNVEPDDSPRNPGAV
jgi:hypothetical protein